jgi:hypothetical protein
MNNKKIKWNNFKSEEIREKHPKPFLQRYKHIERDKMTVGMLVHVWIPALLRMRQENLECQAGLGDTGSSSKREGKGEWLYHVYVTS